MDFIASKATVGRRFLLSLLGLPLMGQLVTRSTTERAIRERSALRQGESPNPAATLIGLLDGVNKVLTLSFSPTGNAKARVFRDGLFQGDGDDYVLVGKTLTMTAALQPDDVIWVDYSAQFNT